MIKKINKFQLDFYDHLKYYKKNNISPVHQNISNLKNHFQRRSFLYDSLGLSKLVIKNSIIAEFGPGSGHNSLYVSNNNPLKYILYEPNPLGFKEIENLYLKYNKVTKPLVVNNKLEDYKGNNKFDVVIAEAWIGSTDHELKLIKKLGKILKKNGLILITFQPAIGMLPNILRRIISYKLIKKLQNFNEQSIILTNFFSQELKSIKNMTRPHIDWVQDTIMNPAALTSSLSLDQIVSQLGNKFEILSTFPKYFKILDWYKLFINDKRNMNRLYTDEIYKSYHSFIDMNHMPNDQYSFEDVEKNRLLDSLINELYIGLYNLEKNQKHFDSDNYIINMLNLIKKNTNNSQLKKMISSTVSLFKNPKTIYNKYHSSDNKLNGIFGRELFYTSIQKKND
ncbi:methyltransferase domain-containing protein [Alphaproteobacteria bacterium]|nr:methyltransferase domain-containing protein [Alphaproteobacteria bacterium]